VPSVKAEAGLRTDAKFSAGKTQARANQIRQGYARAPSEGGECTRDHGTGRGLSFIHLILFR